MRIGKKGCYLSVIGAVVLIGTLLLVGGCNGETGDVSTPVPVAATQALSPTSTGMAPTETATPAPSPAYSVPPELPTALIEEGAFSMGREDGYACERPVHVVSLSSFYIGETEVTYAQWMGVKNWAEQNGYTFNREGHMGARYGGDPDETHPATEMEWYDAVLWCNALSEIEGRTPAYYLTAAREEVYRSGRVDITNSCVDWEADGYRLPTEAEWEYACRAGTTTAYSSGNAISGEDANFLGSGDPFDDGTTPVGSYEPNDWGLHDMHGNAREWCWDWFDWNYYTEDTVTNPHGPLEGYLPRVYRGGSCGSDPEFLLSAYRDGDFPDQVHHDRGFRVARTCPDES